MKAHILITAVDSRDKHGLEGVVVRAPTELEAYIEFLQWVQLLAEEWKTICVSISTVGGQQDPCGDGELLNSFVVVGETVESRTEALKNMLVLKVRH